MTGAPLDEQGPLFTERERAELDPYRYQVTPHKSLNVVELATAWAAHVRKLDADRTMPPDDPRTWGPYDLVAALHIRDFLVRCAEQLPAELKDRVAATVAPSDQLFQEITQPDDGQLVARVEQESVAGRPWWWHRVPDSGPLLDELRALT